MDEQAAEMEWTILAMEGLDRFHPEELPELALWAAGHGPAARTELAAANAAEAGHLHDFALALLRMDHAELAVLPARLALAGFERFAGDESRRMGLLTLAGALLRCAETDEVLPLDELRELIGRFEGLPVPQGAAGLSGAFLAIRLARLEERAQFLQGEDDRLWAWARRTTEASPGPVGTAAAMIGKVAGQVDDPDLGDALIAEMGCLQAASGDIGGAMATADGRLRSPRGRWHGARVYAEAERVLRNAGDHGRARNVLARAVAEASAISAREADGEAQALHDLLAGLDAGARVAAVELLPPELRQVGIEHVVARLIDDDDQSALALAGEVPLDHGLLADLAGLAARKGLAGDARRLSARLAGTPSAHMAVEVLLDIGAEGEALMLLPSLAGGDERAEGLSMAARHFGIKGDAVSFERHALAMRGAWGVEGGAVPVWRFRRLADGLLGLLSPDGAVDWVRRGLPAAVFDDMVFALACSLEEGGRLEEAGRLAGRADQARTRERIQDRLAQAQANRNVLEALAHSRRLADAGRWDDAHSALASLRNPFLFLDACAEVAERAAAGDLHAAARALRAPLSHVPGRDLIMADALRFAWGRRLGGAVARHLPRDWRDAFGLAALNLAGEADAVNLGAPLVLAAAYAVLPGD